MLTQNSLPSFMTVNEFSAWARMGRTKTYELLGRGEIVAVKMGRRTLIRADSAEAWLSSQPTYR